MKTDDGQYPRVSNESKCLGVREPPNLHADVDVDKNDNVQLNGKGMSVGDDWRQLQGHLIPEHLDDGLNAADGKEMAVFVHGEGPFQEASVAANLKLLLKPGSTSNGVVAPKVARSLADYQADLAATQSDWVIDET